MRLRVELVPASAVAGAAGVTLAAFATVAPVPAPVAAILATAAAVLVMRVPLRKAAARSRSAADVVAQVCARLGVAGRRPESALAAADRIAAQMAETAAVLGMDARPDGAGDRLDRFLTAQDGILKEWQAVRDKAAKGAFALDDMPGLCRLSQAHVDATIRESEGVAWDLMERMRGLDRAITVLVLGLERYRQEHAAALADAVAAGATASAILRRLETLEALQSSNTRAAEAARAALREAFEAVDDRARALGEMLKRLTGLAFNTTIEYTRMGSERSGIGVIAAEYLRFAHDIAALSAAATEAIGLLGAALNEAGASAAARNAADRGAVRGLHEFVVATEARAVSTELALDAWMNGFGGEAAAMSTMAMNALGAMQTQDIFRQKMEGTAATFAALSSFATSLQSYLGDPLATDPAAVRSLISNVATGYVTVEQRRLHAALTGEGDAIVEADLPEIELF